MKKTDLKAMLKPLIKECIKEVMFEEGVLSGIVSEVARGISATPIREQQKAPTPTPNEFKKMRADALEEQRVQIDSHRKRLLDSIGTSAYNGVNLFEGTTPMASAPAPGAAPTPSSPLAGVAASDAGVDITNLFGSVGNHWKAHLDSEK